MAQSKSNQLNPAMSFRTKTTTPSMILPSRQPTPLNVQGTINAFAGAGGQSRIPNQSSYTAPVPQRTATTPPPVRPATTPQSGNTGALGFVMPTAQSQPVAPQPAPQPQVQPFRGILDSLLGASSPTNDQQRARREMERIAAGNKKIGEDARAIADKYGAEIARIGQLGAGAVAGNLSTGTNVVGSGNAAIASQSASQRMEALAKGLDAELQGTAQQLTGQEQQANAFNPSLQATLTQQQQQLSGLGAAGGLAQPMQLPYSSGAFNPLTGEQIGGGFGGWAGYTTAQQVQSLIEQYPDAGIQYNPNLTPEQNLQMVQQALRGSPTYQRGTYGVAGGTSPQGAANITLGQQGYQQFGLQTEALRQSINTAENFGRNLASVMEQFSINGAPLRAVNIPFNKLLKQFAPEMTAFQAALKETANAYNQVFASTGTTPTNAGEISDAIFNENSTPQQMIAALEQLEQQARAKLNVAQQSTTGFYGLLPGQGGASGGFSWDSI